MRSGDKDSLLLPNLAIKGFRGIKSLLIPELGRVTLLTGKNGVGKTTVLEAARIWSARGSGKSLKQLLLSRDEISASEDGRLNQPGGSFVSKLFWGRNPKLRETILIGPYNPSLKLYDRGGLNMLQLEFSRNNEPYILNLNGRSIHYPSVSILTRTFNNAESKIIWILDQEQHELIEAENEIDSDLLYNSIGMGSLSKQTMLEFWDKVALTSDERMAVNALNLATGGNITQIAAIGENNSRRLMAKSKLYSTPIPVKNLGDGANKLLWLTLAMACSQNGFLFIDEAENGIHHTVHEDFWKIVMQTALEKNVQVLATTHSFGCLIGFANAAALNKEVEGVVVRIEETEEGLRAVQIGASALRSIIENGIEIR